MNGSSELGVEAILSRPWRYRAGGSFFEISLALVFPKNCILIRIEGFLLPPFEVSAWSWLVLSVGVEAK